MLDDGVFLKGMDRLMNAFKDYECGPDTVDLYREFLGHLTREEFKSAIDSHIKKYNWFPKIAELLKAVPTHAPTPIDLWNLLLAAAETGVKPEMDAATERALTFIGGWETLCYTDLRELSFKFKDFKATLLDARDQEEAQLVLQRVEHKPAQVES